MNADRGGCVQNCVNLQGSYECSCQQGYNIASDGFNCDGKRLIINRALKMIQLSIRLSFTNIHFNFMFRY